MTMQQISHDGSLPGLIEYDNPYHVQFVGLPYDPHRSKQPAWQVQIMDSAYEEFVRLDAKQSLSLLSWLEEKREMLERIAGVTP